MRVGRPVKPPAWFWPAALLCQLAPKVWTPIPQLMGVKIAQRNTLMAKNRPCSASIAHLGPGSGPAVGPLPLSFAMNIALTRKSAIAQTGLVRCDTRRPPNEGGTARSFACPRFEADRHSVWYSTACRTRLSADDALLFRPVGPFHHLWPLLALSRIR